MASSATATTTTAAATTTGAASAAAGRKRQSTADSAAAVPPSASRVRVANPDADDADTAAMVYDDQDDGTVDWSKYTLRKRPVFRPLATKTDIYLSRTSHFPALWKRAVLLLGTEKKLTIHGMGAAILTAVSLAQQLDRRYGDAIVISTTTSSVRLVDDFVPTDPTLPERTRVRFNSAVRIAISTAPAAAAAASRRTTGAGSTSATTS